MGKEKNIQKGSDKKAPEKSLKDKRLAKKMKERSRMD